MGFTKSVLLFATPCLLSFVVAVSVQAAATIEWDPERLSIRQTQGSIINQTLTVTFSEDAVALTPLVTPSFESWLTVQPTMLPDMQAGQSLQIKLSGVIPADEPLGIQRGVLQIRSGVNQSNLAKPIPIAITIIESSSDSLPPDPGEEGKLTLMGIDSDGDGLRDDVQRYIYLTYLDQANVQRALRQFSLSLQKTIDPLRAVGTERELAREIGSDIDCVSYFVDESFYDTVQLLQAEVINTYDRTRQHLAYDKELSGGIFSASGLRPSERYKACDFEIAPQ